MREGVQILYTLTQPATVVAELRSVHRAAGETPARHALLPHCNATSLTWDGKLDNGAAAPRGLYLLVLTATGDDARTVRAAVPCVFQ